MDTKQIHISKAKQYYFLSLVVLRTNKLTIPTSLLLFYFICPLRSTNAGFKALKYIVFTLVQKIQIRFKKMIQTHFLRPLYLISYGFKKKCVWRINWIHQSLDKLRIGEPMGHFPEYC